MLRSGWCSIFKLRILFFIRQFHRLHSEWGHMTSETAINAVPVLEEARAHQEWSLRLNLTQHGKTHQGET